MKTKLRELSRETLQNIILDLSESLIEAQSQKLQALIERQSRRYRQREAPQALPGCGGIAGGSGCV